MNYMDGFVLYYIMVIYFMVLQYLYYTITLWFPCLDVIWLFGVILRAFLNSSNIPNCLDQAIQTRKP
jgi:hypothetical protein